MYLGASRESTSKVVWQDITEEFLKSTKELSLGELLKCDHFTLLEAMSALELMDPKMDSGMMLKRTNRKILNLEQSVKAGIVKVNHLELNELIGIIDETYSCIVTWLEGHSLAQTVLTNLYLLDPERIEDRCLRIFSNAILKIVDFMDRLVHNAFCIEEEDFQLNGGKYSLASQISDQKVLNSIEELCQYYEKFLTERPISKTQQNHLPNNNGSSNNNKKQHQQLEQLEQQIEEALPDYDKSQLVALITRLRFTYNFYACFLDIYRTLVKNNWELNFQTEAQLLKTTKLVQSSVNKCDQHLEKCLNYLPRWKKSIDLGIKPESKPDTIFNEADYPTIMGFDPFINFKLLNPSYPKFPPIKTRPFMVDYLRDLIIRLRQCISISNSFNQKSFDKSLESIEYFSKYFQPSSCVISRSLIQILYLPNRSEKLLKDELMQSLGDFCEPVVQSIKKDEAKAAIVDSFFNECSRSFLQAISIYGHNTARQHERYLDLMSCYKNLQISALSISHTLGNAIVYSWITNHLGKICIKYTLAGLELELFSPHEYPYVFWYLYDMLYKCEREQLEISRRYICEAQAALEGENLKKTKGKKNRKKNQFSTSYHDKGLLSNDAFRFLTGGLFLLTYGLRLQGKIKSPSTDFTNEEICFERRFAASAEVYHAYQSYKQTLSKLGKLEYVYREALECFSEAKDLFQTLGDNEDCLKVCRTNMVVAKILSSDSNSLTSREVEFCFNTHSSFPIVKV